MLNFEAFLFLKYDVSESGYRTKLKRCFLSVCFNDICQEAGYKITPKLGDYRTKKTKVLAFSFSRKPPNFSCIAQLDNFYIGDLLVVIIVPAIRQNETKIFLSFTAREKLLHFYNI